MTVSIYLLGCVVSLIVIPSLSETYDRKLVLVAANIVFCVWQVGCAMAPNIAALIIARFCSGPGGAVCLVCMPLVKSFTCFIAYGRRHRGRPLSPWAVGLAIGVWYAGPLLGPIIGPPAWRVHYYDDWLAVGLSG